MTGRSSLSKVHRDIRKESQQVNPNRTMIEFASSDLHRRPDIPFIERLGQRHFVIEDILSSRTDGDFTQQTHIANHFLPVVYKVSNPEYKAIAAFCADPRCLTT